MLKEVTLRKPKENMGTEKEQKETLEKWREESMRDREGKE